MFAERYVRAARLRVSSAALMISCPATTRLFYHVVNNMNIEIHRRASDYRM